MTLDRPTPEKSDSAFMSDLLNERGKAGALSRTAEFR